MKIVFKFKDGTQTEPIDVTGYKLKIVGDVNLKSALESFVSNGMLEINGEKVVINPEDLYSIELIIA